VRLWTGFSQIPTIQVLFSNNKNPKSNSRSGSKPYNLLQTAQGSVFFSGENSIIFDKEIGSFFVFSSVNLTSFAIFWLNFAKMSIY
jgi:hypothetical protein